MLGWLTGRGRREAALERELSEARAELASIKAAPDELLVAGGQGGVPLGTSQELSRATEQLAHFRGWTFACVHAIASRIAGQAVHVGRRGKQRPTNAKGWNPPGVTPLESHALLDLLNDPNDLQIAWSLWYFTVANLELTGRCLWYVPDQDRPQIYPIPTSWLVGFEGTTRFDAFKVRPPGHVEPTIIPADEACYFFYPSPLDPREAASPLQAAAYAVTADDEIQRSQVAAFKNGIFPKHGIIIGERAMPDGSTGGAVPQLTAAQRRQLIDAVMSLYRGASRTGEPIILDALVKDIKALSTAPAEMDWTESGKAVKARICQIFGVNPIILGEIESANRASSLAAEQHLAGTLNPKLRLIGATIQEWLAPRFGDGLSVWFDEYTPHDPEMDLKRHELLARYGCLEVNELRTWAGKAEVDWGGAPVSPPGGVNDALADAIDGKLAAIGSREIFGGKMNGKPHPLGR